MAYYNDDQLLKYFENAMKNAANKQIKALQDEIKKIYTKEITKVMDSLNIKHGLEKSRALREVNTHYQEKINHIGLTYDKELIDERQKLTHTIFSEVTSKLKSYIKTKDYSIKMLEKISKTKALHPKSPMTLYIGLDDEPLFKALQSKLEIYDQLLTHPDIKLGGFIALFKDQKIEYDHSFDTTLKEQMLWFSQEAKLFVRS